MSGKTQKIQKTQTEWEELVRRYESGEILLDLAKEQGCSDRVLRKYLARYGAVIRPRGYASKVQKDEWARNKEAGAKPDRRIPYNEMPPKPKPPKRKPKRKVVDWL